MTCAAMRFMFAGGGAARRRGALIFVGVFLGLNLLFGITGLGDFLAGAAIGWKAHAAGFLAGVALSFLLGGRGLVRKERHPVRGRSEEHTSELQSLMRISYAVFCLKKKNKHKHNSNDRHHNHHTIAT